MVEVLRLFWDKGVRLVSSGALAMTMARERGLPSAPPFPTSFMASIKIKGARWDGTWLVLEARP